MADTHGDEAEIWNNLGNSLCRRGLWEQAIDAYRKALEIQPALVDAHCNLGVALVQNGELDAGIASQRRAIELNGSFPAAYNNLGSALLIAGRFDEAERALDRAIQLRADFAEAHFSRSLIWLMRGDFERGWAEYEWRLRGRSVFMQGATKFNQPRWDGGDLNGRTILLHAEAGLGDSIQFVRYAPMVARRGGRVIVGCQPALAGLFRAMEGIDEIVTPAMPLPSFDVHCPLLSLPLAFSTRLETIPWNGAYLRADSSKAELWRAKMGGGFKVGVAWKGDSRNMLDRWRSIEWPPFSRILSVAGARFFSLQKEKTVESTGIGIVDWTEEFHDFSDTAGLVANLDLVITVDTAIAHLAGAMGKPVWVIISASPDFRWMLDRQDSPWYPSMRLFRQKAIGDWDGVLLRVMESLFDLRNRK
jgi:tetratricopeptide repeat protein/glycosyl transferase family 9 (putative heptosyltransferase)